MRIVFSRLLIITMIVSFIVSPGAAVSHAYPGDDPCYGLDHCFIATNVVGTTATLEWEPIEGVQSYSLKITIPINYDDTDEVVLDEKLDIDDLLFDSDKNRYIFELTGLKSGTLHYAMLKYGEGDVDWSPLYFNTLTIVEPPANVEVIDITGTSATVQWTNNPGISEYYISWGPELSAYVRDGSGSYTIANLTSNTAYTVSIYALVGTTQTSEPVEIPFTTTEAAIVWPAEVNIKAEDITHRTATLVWDAVPGATEYHLSDGRGWEVTLTDTTYALTGLIPSTGFTYKLTASNGKGSSPEYTHTFTTLVEPPAHVEVVNITETSATVQWTNNPDHTQYLIRWGPELSAYVRDGSGSYTIANLTSNTAYTVSIYALVGTTQTSEPVEIPFTTMEAAIVWPIEVNIKAEGITDRTATLVWDAVPGATEYHLSDGKGWEVTLTDTTYALTGLTPSTGYTYKLTASNGMSFSQEYSITFTTAIAAVDHETITVDTLTHESIKLTFDAVDGAEYYAFDGAKYYYWDKGTSITIYRLAHHTSYTIKLYAVHPGGIESAPTLFTFTTLAPPLPGDANLSALDFRVEYQEGLNVTLGWSAWIPDAARYELIIDGGEPEYFAREDMHWYTFHARFTKSLTFRQNGTHTAILRGVNVTGKSKAYELTFTVTAREANPTQSVVPGMSSAMRAALNALEDTANQISNNSWDYLPQDAVNAIMGIVNQGMKETGSVIFTTQVEGNVAKATVSATDIALAVADNKEYAGRVNEILNKLGANPVKPAVILDFEDVTLQSAEIKLDASAMKTLLDAGVESVTIKLNGTQVSIHPKEFPNGFELNRGQQSAPTTNTSNDAPNFVSDVYSFKFTDNNGEHANFTNPVGVSLSTQGLGNVDTALLTVVNVGETSSAGGDTTATVIGGEPTTIIGNFGGVFNSETGTVDTVLHGFSSYAVIENKVNFNDIGSVQWAERSIQVAAAKGIVVGDGNGNYNPAGDVTRAEFLKMLITTFHLKAPNATEPFIDVNDSDWFSPYVKAGLNSGIIDSSIVFNPRAAITREEMAQMIGRVLKNQPGAFEIANADEILKDFPDAASISSNRKDDLAFAVLKGVMIGKDKGFEPTAKTTRAEAAVIVMRLIDLK